MNNKKFNSRNGSDSGSIVRNTLKAHRDQVKAVRNSVDYRKAMNTVSKRAKGRSELSGKKCKIERHHIEDVQYHIDKACDANNIVALSHMEHKLYHEVYNRTKSGVTVDKPDTEAMWNQFVKAFKAGKLEKHMKVVKAKDARVKQIAKFVGIKSTNKQSKALKDIANIDVIKMIPRKDGDKYMVAIVDAENRDKVRKAFLDNHIQIRKQGGNFKVLINA